MQRLTWAKVRGRNGWDSVLETGAEFADEVINLHLYDSGLGTKRGGTTSVTITGVTAPINAMASFIPGQDVTASELFVVDSSATTKILRCAGGATFSNLTLTDNVASSPTSWNAVTLNGKLYMAYDTTVNRLHVFDPSQSTTTVRRAGLGTPAAPTVANGGGGGAYAAVIRYYRVAYTVQSGGVTLYRSLLSPSVSFTPSGANANATVTKPASISEGETHWELYGSADGVTFYLLATTVVGTTTYADTAAPSSYASGQAMPTEGANTPFPSVKFLATDGVRLLGFGVWESTAGDSLAPKNGRVYFGPVLDSSLTPYAVQDDERINNTTTLQGFIDISRNANAEDRGITPRPVNGNFFAFQSNGVYAVIPTDSPIQPFRREAIDPDIGCTNHKAIVVATDHRGLTAAYFLDPVKGPYTVGGPYGLRWCGKDVADIWATVNLAGTMWGVWYPDRLQVIFAVPTGAATDPNMMLVLDVSEQRPDEHGDLRGGWTVYDSNFANSRCGVMFNSTLASPRPRTKVPYVGNAAALGLGRYDETVFTDYGNGYATTLASGALYVDPVIRSLMRAYLFIETRATAALTFSLTLKPNTETLTTQFAGGTRTFSLATTPPVSTRLITLLKSEDAAMQDAWMLQVIISTSASLQATYNLSRFVLDVQGEQYY